MNIHDLKKIFLKGAGIEDEEEDMAVCVGFLRPYQAIAGVDAVMEAHTREVQKLIDLLPTDSPQRLKLFSYRGFSREEYYQLFLQGINEKSLKDFPVCACLKIHSLQELRTVIYHFSKDDDEYLSLLFSSCTAYHLIRFFLGYES